MVASSITLPLAPTRGRLSFNIWNPLWETRLHRCASQFNSALQTPQRTQEALLRGLLKQNAASEYGREHGFAAIESVEEFRARVPLVDYDTLAPWIDQIARGNAGVLTKEPVIGLRRSAGLGDGVKTLPVTQSFLQELSLGMDTWLADWMPKEIRGSGNSVYWAMPPARRAPERSEGGILFASDSLEQQLSRLGRLALTPHLAVPTNVSEIANEARWRRTTLVNLLAAQDLRVMVTGNPAMLLDLFAELQENLADMLQRLPEARANAIREALDREGRLRARCLWPQLQTVVSWTDGASAPLCDALAEYFWGVRLQTAPITTQEALLTVPRQGLAGAPLAITSHFFEFIDLDAGRGPTLLAHALRVGGTYQPVVTTGSGLYRYQTGEAVRCTGFSGKTPLLTYVGKTAPQSDCVGECLTPAKVQAALEVAQARLPLTYRFAMCVPTGDKPAGYTLFIETDAGRTSLDAAAAIVEEQLCSAHPYWYSRQLGQLHPLRVARVTGGWQRYVRALQDNGINRWEVKATALDRRSFWPSILRS